MTTILLVGGNKRQRELLERHMNLKAIDLRHIFQGSSQAPSVPSKCEAVIIWTKHCSHKLEQSVVAEMGAESPKLHKVRSSVELLNVLVDVLWDKQEQVFKHKMMPHPQTQVECAVPSPIHRTGHRLDEFWRDVIGMPDAEPTAVDPQMDEALQDMLDQADMEETMDRAEEEEETPTFVGGRAELPRMPPPADPTDEPYAGKISIIVEIENQEGDVVGSRQLSMEIDGGVLDLPMLTRGLAGHIGEVVGAAAIQKMFHGRSDPVVS